MKELIFYTRRRCGLCEEAKRTINLLRDDFPFKLIERDIEERDEWTERFGLMIPVVEMDGEILQYGQIDLFTISKRLHEKTR
ncbi:glutaredoxin family protein [Rossellomorea marisflavi]|uniref:NrdH-redoxin n=2 Tax=Rossellomorea marisflavi TaxID=189381 RepID=A0A165LYZ3_9BACI|nr:glutaredoxin family protein [Rossellomorea marisflavi]KZE53369.1 NrdH-redoxin [Rossellomorea marisflavi]TYO69610.1 glutaredoxin family protein [Rossellomorea marisflavi]